MVMLLSLYCIDRPVMATSKQINLIDYLHKNYTNLIFMGIFNKILVHGLKRTIFEPTRKTGSSSSYLDNIVINLNDDVIESLTSDPIASVILNIISNSLNCSLHLKFSKINIDIRLAGLTMILRKQMSLI